MKDFICFLCGRQQSYAPKSMYGGITEEEAELIGWRRVEGEWKWLCPLCSGNEEKLNQVFNQ